MAQPEIVKDMFLKVNEYYTDSLNNTNLIPGSYALQNYTDASSPFSGIYGTLIQSAGIYKPQMVFGSSFQQDNMKVFIRRYKYNLNSFTPWIELLTTDNYTSILDERYMLKTSSSSGTSAIIYRITEV